MKSTFEKMGGTYTLGADGIYYPNLVSTMNVLMEFIRRSVMNWCVVDK